MIIYVTEECNTGLKAIDLIHVDDVVPDWVDECESETEE